MSLKSLIATGTKVWLDSIDPELVRKNYAAGATGATSNPIIISDLIKTGRFDSRIERFMEQGVDDSGIAWAMTDLLVKEAQQVFAPVWESTRGNNGYVSFELDAGAAHVLVDLGLDGDVDDRAGAELVDHVAEIEGDALHARLALLDEELEVVAGLADAAGRAGDGQAAAAEQRLAVGVAERAEALQILHE